eukprot:scaffold15093_cov114-Isochrysis_galbana.AAC.5
MRRMPYIICAVGACSSFLSLRMSKRQTGAVHRRRATPAPSSGALRRARLHETNARRSNAGVVRPLCVRTHLLLSASAPARRLMLSHASVLCTTNLPCKEMACTAPQRACTDCRNRP